MEIQCQWPLKVRFQVHQSRSIGQQHRDLQIQIEENSIIRQLLQYLLEEQKIVFQPDQAIVEVNGTELSVENDVQKAMIHILLQKELKLHVYYKATFVKRSTGSQIPIQVELKDNGTIKKIQMQASLFSSFNEILPTIQDKLSISRMDYLKKYYSISCNGQEFAPSYPIAYLKPESNLLKFYIEQQKQKY